MTRFATQIAAATLFASSLCYAVAVHAAPETQRNAASGIVRVPSDYPMAESIARVKADIAKKGILFFQEIDQKALAEKAGIPLRASTLLVFGNPPLGTQFITANPDAGLDWPVRLLLTQDDSGKVWAVYTDFAWIAKRHEIRNRETQFNTATGVVDSITSTLRASQ